MKRVLKITSGLMGVLLLGLTAGLFHSRQQGPLPETVLVMVYDGWGNSELRRVFVGNDFQQTIIPTAQRDPMKFKIIGWSSDRKWLYYTDDTDMIFHHDAGIPVRLFRVRSNGSHREALTEPMFQYALSPDKTWLAYTTFSPNSAAALHWIPLNGGQRITLDAIVASPRTLLYTVGDEGSVYVASNQQILYQAWHNDNYRVMVVERDGAPPHPFILELTGFTQIQYWTPDGEWILLSSQVQGPSGLYRVRPDGSDLRELPREFFSDIQAWSPIAGGIILLRTATDYAGILLSDGGVLWRAEEVSHIEIDSSYTWMLLWFNDGRLALQRFDGRQRTMLDFPIDYFSFQGWSADDKWFFWQTQDLENYISEIWRFNLTTRREERIYRGDGVIQMQPMLPNDEWIYFVERLSQQLYRIRPDGSQRQWVGNTSFAEAIEKSHKFELTWQPLPLFFAGAALLIGSLIAGRHRQLKFLC